MLVQRARHQLKCLHNIEQSQEAGNKHPAGTLTVKASHVRVAVLSSDELTLGTKEKQHPPHTAAAAAAAAAVYFHRNHTAQVTLRVRKTMHTNHTAMSAPVQNPYFNQKLRSTTYIGAASLHKPQQQHLQQ